MRMACPDTRKASPDICGLLGTPVQRPVVMGCSYSGTMRVSMAGWFSPRRRRVASLIREAMRGQLGIPCTVILAAQAVESNAEQPRSVWRIQEVAIEAADQRTAIDSSRNAVLTGVQPSEPSTFDVARDSWVCYIASDVNADSNRCLCIEILDPVRFDDCGAILDVTHAELPLELLDQNKESWILDGKTMNLRHES